MENNVENGYAQPRLAQETVSLANMLVTIGKADYFNDSRGLDSLVGEYRLKSRAIPRSKLTA